MERNDSLYDNKPTKLES